jgi:signal transduction histidine kinase
MASVPDTLLTAEATLSTAIQHLRALSKSFSRQWLDQFSLIDNLKAEIDRINASKAITVKFSYDVMVLPLQAEPQIILFRIIQEAIQNSIKHAQPQIIDISMRQSNQQLIVIIADDGAGFDKSVMAKGLGIRNMQHRTKLLKGNINWEVTTAGGTAVVINLPLVQSL